MENGSKFSERKFPIIAAIVSIPTIASIVMIALLAIASLPRIVLAAGAISPLEGNHPDEAADLASEGSAQSSRQLKMRLMLALNHRKDLEKLLAEQQDSSSPEYHRWLTPDEFSRRFGPTDAQIAKVSRWITDQGFKIESTSAASRTITFSGSVAQVEKALGVKIAATADGSTFANTTDPAVPADLAPLIDSFEGLDNTIHA